MNTPKSTLLRARLLGALLGVVALTIVALTCRRAPITADQPLDDIVTRLAPLCTALPPAKPGEWLWTHAEAGESFHAYVERDPIRATAQRGTIYLLLIGEFDSSQRRIVDLTAQGLEAYFGLPVRSLAAIDDVSDWPAHARRHHPEWGLPQLLSTYILDDILGPRLPDDAAVLLGFSAVDLWPGRGWNFVFGQASLRQRVGVWSIARNGDPAASEAAFRLCLLRTLKTATHETGHMFSMRHCVAYACNMCGSNHREESDSRPLALCAECLPKLCFATGSDPLARYRRLALLYRDWGLEQEARDCELRCQVLDDN